MKLHSLLTMFFIAGSIALLIVFIIAYQPSSQDIRSKASNPSPVVIPTVLPAPKTLLTSPYLRLVTMSKQAIVGQPLKVALIAKDEKNSIAEIKIALTYDPSQLSLGNKNIENANVFPVMNLERFQNGVVEFSLFNTTEEAGYEPVVIEKETVIAYLTFTPLTSSALTRISLLGREGNDAFSGIFTPRMENGVLGANILMSVEGADITIQ